MSAGWRSRCGVLGFELDGHSPGPRTPSQEVGDAIVDAQDDRLAIDMPLVVPAGREGDREVEVDAATERTVPLDGAGQCHRAPEQRCRLGKVTGGNRRSDLGAAHQSSVEREWLDDHHLEAVATTEHGQGLRSSLSLVPEGRVRSHQEPAQLDPMANPLDEHVVGRLAQRGIEGLDDGHVDAGRGESFEALGRVEQEWRRMAGQHLVGMVVEGDHRRPRPSCRRLDDEVSEQVEMAEVEAVEDTDDDECRAQFRPERLDPADDLHPDVSRRGRPGPAR